MFTQIFLKKILANFIDLFISLFIRLASIAIILVIFQDNIKSQINDVFLKLKDVTNQSEAFDIIINSPLPQTIMILIIIFILIGSCYYIYFQSSSWCATIGQRIANIILVKNNSEYVKFSTIIIHYILSVIPFFVTLYFILFMITNRVIINTSKDLLDIFTANNFNIFLTIFIILWINIPLFVKNKKSLADIICQTKIEIGKTDSKFPKFRNL